MTLHVRANVSQNTCGCIRRWLMQVSQRLVITDQFPMMPQTFIQIPKPFNGNMHYKELNVQILFSLCSSFEHICDFFDLFIIPLFFDKPKDLQIG